ncbi:MAG TPA: acetyl-CoA C-acyltransferase [Thermoanaerobaculia bacterium]|nr:acetyl-CoA C-acyltransferase [Thermoanaerobaculia bacterium]
MEDRAVEDIVILSAVRTPIGAFQGALAGVAAPELGARAIAAAVERAGLQPSDVDQVNMGCVLTAGVGQAPARQAAIAAGCPTGVGALTVGKVCGSGMRAVMIGANDLRCGDFRVVVAGGMESMSQAPYLVPGAREGLRLGHGRLIDSMTHDGLWDPYDQVAMGSCGEICAREYSFSREEQDDFARESYRRARAASEDGRAAREIAGVPVKQRKGDPKVVDVDEEPFRVDLERMATLKPAFDPEGTITAANASKINDGAAALVLTTAPHAERLGRRPLARIVAHSSHAQEPKRFTTAPAKAVGGALARAGLSPADVDLWEVNEAFAVVALAFLRDLDLDPERVNVRGGAVALGHPIGASGAGILVTLLHAMAEGGDGLGCAAICIGGGEATAMVVERLEG